jgi:Na+-transporting NADH:ubiquinone oxidoreductase subunit A
MIKITKGLDLPITGSPMQKIFSGPTIKTVAVVGDDFRGMKPSMLVQVGDKVRKGQPLFEDKKTPGVMFTAPAAGVVKEINRGERRAFQSVVIDISGYDQVQFKNYTSKSPADLSADEVRALLIESGLWTSLRTRPFSKTPAVDASPAAIFVNAMDTQPLAPDPSVVLAEHADDFKAGVTALAKLAPKIYVVTDKKLKLDLAGIQNLKQETFDGPHPAGNVGTHIHFLEPVSATKVVWHLNYQDTIAIGRLFKSGEYFTERVISIAGPASRNPRLVRTIQGASIAELTVGETFDTSEIRYVSGSVLGGRTSKGALMYLGHFHLQVTMLKEGRHREFLGWHSPGLNKFSLKNVFLAKMFPNKKFNFDTNTNGSLRSIVPIGSFEAVMPMDILPTQLLRYLMARDTDVSANLGALELDEEDLALCTFVDPCKNEYGPVLREVLNTIEKEG